MTPSDHAAITEQDLLSCCYLDAGWVDKALQAGLAEVHFTNDSRKLQWRTLCELRASGESTESGSVFAHCHKHGNAGRLGSDYFELSRSAATTAGAAKALSAILDTHAKREAFKRFRLGIELLKTNSADVADVKRLADEVSEVCSGVRSVSRPLRDIADEAIADAEEAIAGQKPSRTLITTGLPMFDRYATPIESHEYVVVGARTSHGKSSFLLQLAGSALAQGRRIVIFSLETSAKAVLRQLVGIRVGCDLRNFNKETGDKQQEFLAKLRFARDSKNLLIFDEDIALDAITARCRLLAQSFQPELVVLDYLGLVGGITGSAYERMSAISKAMIPLRKALGCTLLVGAQLNRGPEKDEREPTRSDFRDAGGIEEDAHRIIALHRRPGQPLDGLYYDYDLLQLKLRDGPLAKVAMRFHAPTTRFFEEAKV